MQEIVLSDDVKPALEWVNNRVLQKVSPARKHGLAQLRFASALEAWARVHRPGTIATEWRFQVQPPSEIRRTLVPDVGFLSYDSMSLEEQDRTDAPAIAPDVVVEIISRSDMRRDIEEKVRVYLAAGTSVVFLVDTSSKTVMIRDRDGSRSIDEGGIVAHPSLLGLGFPARDLFEPIPPRLI